MGTHISVLLDEVVAALAPRADGIYVDGTFGRGGYSRALLATKGAVVWGIDRDPQALAVAAGFENEFAPRFSAVAGCFGDMDTLLNQRGVALVDGVALDLGVSSPQLDQPERGFSFREDGPLDMRMGNDGPTAADVVNTMPETELADMIFELGEERHARRVAKAVVAARAKERFERTLQLASVVRSVVPHSKDGIDPATRTFQALRLYVNDEMGELDRGLIAAERLLKSGGKIAVVSFHSLEDRRVKNFLRERCGDAPSPSRHAPIVAQAQQLPTFRSASRQPVTPSAEELSRNPRARSARLRFAERTENPAWVSAPYSLGGIA